MDIPVTVCASRLADALIGHPEAFARVLIEVALLDQTLRGGVARSVAAEIARQAGRPGAALPLAGFLAALGGAP